MRSFFIVFSSFLLIQLSKSNPINPPAVEIKSERNDPTVTGNKDSLILAHVIFRHGERNIAEPYPNDPYKDESHWPEGFGQLTNNGKMQHYKLGKYFRDRYSDIIDTKYSPDKIYVQSTDVDRTLMSAQTNLAGFYEPNNDTQKWNKKILWQPIPVHTIPKDLDYVLAADTKCKKYKAAYKVFKKESEKVQKIYSKYEDLFRYWSEMSGTKIKKIKDVHWLWKILFTEKIQNKPLPDWAKEEIQDKGTMEYIATFHHTMSTGTPFLARLKSGFLLKEMLEHFSDKIKSTLTPDRSLWLYSAHETTIARMLNSLGLFNMVIPPYASSLHFELYKTDSDDHYIQIYYRSRNEEDPSPLNIPGCGEKCKLKELYDIYKDIIPGDYDSECQLNDDFTFGEDDDDDDDDN